MIRLLSVNPQEFTIAWDPVNNTKTTCIYWSDRETSETSYRLMKEIHETDEKVFTLKKATFIPHYILICHISEDGCVLKKESFVSPVHFHQEEQLEKLSRGLTAVKVKNGIFLSWRLFLNEVTGVSDGGDGLTGVNFRIFRNGVSLGVVTDSTNYLDSQGTESSVYCLAPVINGVESEPSEPVRVWEHDYLDIPVKKPAGGVTPSNETFTYSANDMSVADVNGDGEYEYIVKWDPSNSHDVSISGYTGNCILDCYQLDGTLLWRLDMGPNIRAGAHYTQFICYDFNGDGKAEMAVKTAPGTRMTRYGAGGEVVGEFYITMPQEDCNRGYSHSDSYVSGSGDYEAHLCRLFAGWQEQPEVKAGQWPDTLEECFHIPPRWSYPLNGVQQKQAVDYFLDVYAPARSPKNRLREWEGFIFHGPEYLTMFAGDGKELDTIVFPFERVDDGLRWGDYAMPRIEPCNRVDRFLAGVAYLDGKRPYFITCRGYYTRAAIAAYSFFENRFLKEWVADSGFVPMKNPFCDNPHEKWGADPVYGKMAGQGNHSLSVADVDGDGCMEIIYGAGCIDHDGTLLYSLTGILPDGREAKLGHGDAMHVADIDPDRPGFEIFAVFEGAENAPYGYALRDGENGQIIFGKYAEEDLGRCMIGDVLEGVRGLQCWVNGEGTYDCHGELMKHETLGTNMSIRWAGDLSTQITDGTDYLSQHPTGVINDWVHGTMLCPEQTATNNGTKGNPCLVADIFGDFREEILVRTKDSTAIRIYTNTEVTGHKLFTLMHDTQYRCGVAWQNNCYNQPCYPKFYYGTDMDFRRVLPFMQRKPVIFLAGDSITQSYWEEENKQTGMGEKLLSCLDHGSSCQIRRCTAGSFPQETRYESRRLVVDNCAMAGRSLKTFLEEGRLEDIKSKMKPGDYLFIQFGHNDAAASKEDRYVPLSQLSEYLELYVEAALEKGGYPVIISPVCLCPFDPDRKGEKEEIARLLPAYRDEMRKFAETRKALFVDLYGLCEEFLWKAGEKTAVKCYTEDLVHLSETGAGIFGQLLANEGKRFIIDGKTEV